MNQNQISLERSTTTPGAVTVWLGRSIVAVVIGGEIIGRSAHLPQWLRDEINAKLAARA